MINKQSLHEYFEYNNGNLYWKKSTNKKIVVGQKAGITQPDGYTYIQLNGKKYKAHRLIFMMHYGYFPIEVDHIDRKRSNNLIENLRAATISQNRQNTTARKNTVSGIKGVSWCKKSKKWRVRLMFDLKEKYFGSYFDIEVARFVVEAMRCKYHGKFANQGE